MPNLKRSGRMPHIINSYQFGAGGGGAFDPESGVTSASMVFGLVAGTDCEVTYGVSCSNGDDVTYFRDLSTNGNDFSYTGTAAYKWHYLADGGAAYNNEPVIEYSGSTYCLLDGPSIAGLSAGEMFTLCHYDADPPAVAADGDFIRTGGSQSAGQESVFFTDGKFYDSFGRSTRVGSANPAADWSAPRIYNAWSASGDWASSLDGTTLLSTATNTPAFHTQVRIGYSRIVGAGKMLGKIRAVLFYDGKLSASDRTAVYNYLDAMRA